MTDHEQIVSKLERVYVAAEANIEDEAKEFGAMHGSIMPRTYVGNRYGVKALDGKPLPRIFMISMNQSRRGNQKKDTPAFDADGVRNSLIPGDALLNYCSCPSCAGLSGRVFSAGGRGKAVGPFVSQNPCRIRMSLYESSLSRNILLRLDSEFEPH